MARDPQAGTALADAKGYLTDPSEWTEEFAEATAESDGELFPYG